MFDEETILKELGDEKLQTCLEEIVREFEAKNYDCSLTKRISKLCYNNSDEFEFEAYEYESCFIVNILHINKDKTSDQVTQLLYEFELEEDETQIKKSKEQTLRSAFLMMNEDMMELLSNAKNNDETIQGSDQRTLC